jgi:Spy/CpxP family protein refolding chaperone
MKGRKFRLAMVLMIFTGIMVLPTLGLAKEKAKETWWAHYMEQRQETLVKALKLSPEKAKELAAIDEKYSKERQGIFERMKKFQADLTAALAAPKPDEAKVKELVGWITKDQDAVMTTFREQRDAEMAMLTTLQQGEYLVTLKKWRKEMMEKHKAVKKEGETPAVKAPEAPKEAPKK